MIKDNVNNNGDMKNLIDALLRINFYFSNNNKNSAQNTPALGFFSLCKFNPNKGWIYF